MERLGTLWTAFEKIAIVFSFVVCFALVMVLLLLGMGVLTIAPALPSLRTDTACPLIADINGLVTDLDNAVITRTISISRSIPVVFNLPLNQNTNVVLTGPVTLQRPTSFTLPAGGGRINGSVTMTLPKGQQLPVHLAMTVPVSQSLPVQMDVPVRIPLNETDLGPVVAKLKALLFPWTTKLGDMLKCPAQ
jgi:hypothetical protein